MRSLVLSSSPESAPMSNFPARKPNVDCLAVQGRLLLELKRGGLTRRGWQEHVFLHTRCRITEFHWISTSGPGSAGLFSWEHKVTSCQGWCQVTARRVWATQEQARTKKEWCKANKEKQINLLAIHPLDCPQNNIQDAFTCLLCLMHHHCFGNDIMKLHPGWSKDVLNHANTSCLLDFCQQSHS